jgi:acetyltransferase-like isoleucine patch superfamily enzyme
MTEQTEHSMTPNQEKYGGDSSSAFKKYRILLSGSDALIPWFILELYTAFISPLPGIIGLGLRSLYSKFIFASVKGRPAIERGVTIRNPGSITIGKGVIIDQGAVLDARRGGEHQPEISFGDNCFIGALSMVLAKGGSIHFGSGVNVSTYTRIASEGLIEIGDSVLISSYCYIGPGNHRFDDPEKPIMEQGMEQGRGIKIGSNCWIGTKVTILDGVTIGNNVIVGAHSLVKESIPDNAIVAGTPAKILKMRE